MTACDLHDKVRKAKLIIEKRFLLISFCLLFYAYLLYFYLPLVPFQSHGEMRQYLSWALWVASSMLVLPTLSGCLMPSSHLFLGLPLGLELDSWLVYVRRAG